MSFGLDVWPERWKLLLPASQRFLDHASVWSGNEQIRETRTSRDKKKASCYQLSEDRYLPNERALVRVVDEEAVILDLKWLVLVAPAMAVYLEQRSLPVLAALLFVHLTLVESILTWGPGFPPGLWPVGLFALVFYLAFRDQADALFYALLEFIGLREERTPGRDRLLLRR